MTDLTIPFTEMTAEQFQAHLDQRSVNTHDAERVASWFTDDAVQRTVATDTIARGRHAIRDSVATIFQAFPDLYLEVRDLFSTDDRMCVQGTATGTHTGAFLGLPPTGRRVEWDGCLVFRFASDGRVSEEIIYYDAATVLRQLGVLPES
jgi:steroid delta-isomerase-like uncharacterized protein